MRQSQPGTAHQERQHLQSVSYSSTGGDTGNRNIPSRLFLPETTENSSQARYASSSNISGVAQQHYLAGRNRAEVHGRYVALDIAYLTSPTVTMTSVAGQPNTYFVTISVAYTSGCSGKTVRPLLSNLAEPDGESHPLRLEADIFESDSEPSEPQRMHARFL